jgi:Cu/Zn superoxide dismutase
MPSTTRHLKSAGLALLLVACAACGSPTQPSAPPPAPSGAPGPINVALADMPTGTVSLRWDPTTKIVTADVDMYGFTPSSSHAMHIHPGSCANQPTPTSVPFPDISATAGGAVKQTVVSKLVPGGIPSGSYLNIHLAPSAQLGTPKDVSFTPIACADIPAGTTPTGPVTLNLKTPPRNGQTPTGATTLTYNGTNHTLRVEMRATGLSPNSAHAVHIHSGSCLAQGDVLYALPDLRVNSEGDASATTTLDNVTAAPPATGWYVNLHLGPMSQILSGNNPTLLFAPILCGDVKG